MLLRADAATNVKGRKTKINEEEFLLSLQRKIPRLKMPFIYIAIRRLQEIVFLQENPKNEEFLEEFRGLKQNKNDSKFLRS